jgi:hypothetical protein
MSVVIGSICTGSGDLLAVVESFLFFFFFLDRIFGKHANRAPARVRASNRPRPCPL